MAITGTEGYDSPEAQNDSQGRVVVKRYQYRNDYDWESEMPAKGTFVAGLGYVRGYASKRGPVYVIVSISYGSASDYSPADNDTTYDYSSDKAERPLELHPDFLMKWKFDLWAVSATSDTPPAWAATATDASDADGISYLWAQDSPGDGWKRLQDRTKPGVDSYIVPSDTVRRRDYFGSKTSAAAAKRTVGEIETPGEEFGVTGGSWLIMANSLVQESGLWAAETEYQHSAIGWDTDLYAAAS